MSDNPNNNLDINFDGDDGQELELLDLGDSEDSESQLDGAAILSSFALDNDGELGSLSLGDGDLVIDNGTNLEIDFEELEGEELGVAEILSTQIDITNAFLSYYQLVHNTRQKLTSLLGAGESKTSFILPGFSEFDFIAQPDVRQLVFGVFGAILRDLVTMPEYAKLDEGSAYQEMVSELYKELHWTPNIHDAELRAIFGNYYQRNKKLAQFKEFSDRQNITDLVDLDRITVAEEIYNINSLPFDIVTKFFNDSKLLNPRATVKLEEHTFFLSDLRPNKTRGGISHKEVADTIVAYLTSDETLQMLHLSEDARAEFTIGEFLRRFVLQELKDGTFYPMSMHKLMTPNYSQQLLSQLYNSLMDAQRRESFAAEILCLILELIADNTMKDDGLEEYFYPFVVGIASYLSAFVNNAAMINPVFYSYIGQVESYDNSHAEYELAFANGDETVTFRSPDILCDVIGDNASVNHIFYTHIDTERGVVVCPPPEVKDNIYKATVTGRMNVNGTVAYKFTPTFSWMSTLSIASFNEVEDKTSHSLVVGKNASTLLNTLLNYDNNFDISGEEAVVLTVDAPEVCSFIGVKMPGQETTRICQLNVDGDSSVVSGDNSVCIIDEDKSMIVRYWDARENAEQVLVIDGDSYTVEQSNITTGPSSTSKNALIDIGSLFPGSLDLDWDENAPYLREVAKHICMLNALDYDAELRRVRRIIIRDLAHVIGLSSLDQMLGVVAMRYFLSLVKEKDFDVDRLNFTTLKELADLTFGKPNLLSQQTSFTPDMVSELEKQMQHVEQTEASMSKVLKKLQGLDLHTLALQGNSRNELSQETEDILYYAMHYIPGIHACLRSLEDQMILVRALVEVGPDIAPVLRKNSAMLAAYNSVCTKDSILSVENALKKGMRIKEVPPCLSITKDILFNTLPENFTILKYFMLERNAYGVLTELEEAFSRGVTQYQDIYNELKRRVGLESIESIGNLSEADFYQRVPRHVIRAAFVDLGDEEINIILDGLITESSLSMDIQAVKCYDMFSAYGRYMFGVSTEQLEDFANTKDFETAFNRYVGSFALSYAVVVGEASGEIDGGSDRYTAYLRNRRDYHTFLDLSAFDEYTLQDLRLVAGSNLLEDGDEGDT